MVECGTEQCRYDLFVCIVVNGKVEVIMGVLGDDIVIAGKLRAKVKAVIRGYAARAFPEGEIPVDEENASHVPSGEIHHCDCQNVDSGIETISEKQDVCVISRRDRKRAEVIDANGDPEPVWQGHRDDGPSDRLPRGFPCMTLQAVA